jgi:hypothetical protein
MLCMRVMVLVGDSRSTYPSEHELVLHFASLLRRPSAPWGPTELAFEFDYEGGYADILARAHDGQVLAFEAKLERWREALHQAYRTRCFAHRAYVVLPAHRAEVALRHEFEFRRRRVGLCAIGTGETIEVLVESEYGSPLQPWLTERAVAAFDPMKGASCRQIRNCRQPHRKSVPTEV